MPSTYDLVTSEAHQERGSSSENTLNAAMTDGSRTEAVSAQRKMSSLTDVGPDSIKEDSEQEYHDAPFDANDPIEDPEKQQKRRDEEDPHFVGPMKPVGFWDPALAKTRKWVLKHWLITVLILMCFIMTVLGMYWAVLFHVQQNLEALEIAVVSFDGQIAPYDSVTPLVGPAVIQATEMASREPGHLGFISRSPAYYNNDMNAIRLAVFDEHIWAAIVVNANATALLQQAVASGNRSYDPLGAAQIIYIEARDQDTYSNYIIPVLQQLEDQISSQFGQQWITNVLSNTSLSATTYGRAPQALNPAIGFSTYNLRPFSPSTATPAVTIGLIYLIIIAFFSFAFFLPIHTKYVIPQGHPPLHFYQLIIWRWLATVVAYFFMSLAYSLVSLAFLIPLSNSPVHDKTIVSMNADAFGKGTFPVYWMLNWGGMCALGLASENVTMVIGQPWTALWLIFWVITNVSTAFYAIELAPGFFKWGYAWPLHSVVGASRTLLFGTHSRIGLNFGILFSWAAVNSALFPVCCVFMRWKSEGEKAKSAGKPKPGVHTLLA